MTKPEGMGFYLNQLKSNECFCGGTKKPKMSFCYPCYKSLPNEMQRALYQRLGDGYEDAYEEACQFLMED
jgi:hypothetical protein